MRHALSSVIALAVVVPTAGQALALLSLCYASLTFAAASVWSLPADVAPTPAHVASIGGIQNFASNLAGVLGATTTGVLIAATGGSYVPALVLSGGLSLVGAFSYLVIVGRVEPLPIPRGRAGHRVTRVRVGLFVTCLADLVAPEVGVATARVLQRAGHEVVFPEGQTCCGQPAFNSGYRARRRKCCAARCARWPRRERTRTWPRPGRARR